MNGIYNTTVIWSLHVLYKPFGYSLMPIFCMYKLYCYVNFHLSKYYYFFLWPDCHWAFLTQRRNKETMWGVNGQTPPAWHGWLGLVLPPGTNLGMWMDSSACTVISTKNTHTHPADTLYPPLKYVQRIHHNTATWRAQYEWLLEGSGVEGLTVHYNTAVRELSTAVWQCGYFWFSSKSLASVLYYINLELSFGSLRTSLFETIKVWKLFRYLVKCYKSQKSG